MGLLYHQSYKFYPLLLRLKSHIQNRSLPLHLNLGCKYSEYQYNRLDHTNGYYIFICNDQFMGLLFPLVGGGDGNSQGGTKIF